MLIFILEPRTSLYDFWFWSKSYLHSNSIWFFKLSKSKLICSNDISCVLDLKIIKTIFSKFFEMIFQNFIRPELLVRSISTTMRSIPSYQKAYKSGQKGCQIDLIFNEIGLPDTSFLNHAFCLHEIDPLAFSDRSPRHFTESTRLSVIMRSISSLDRSISCAFSALIWQFKYGAFSFSLKTLHPKTFFSLLKSHHSSVTPFYTFYLLQTLSPSSFGLSLANISSCLNQNKVFSFGFFNGTLFLKYFMIFMVLSNGLVYYVDFAGGFFVSYCL